MHSSRAIYAAAIAHARHYVANGVICQRETIGFLRLVFATAKRAPAPVSF